MARIFRKIVIVLFLFISIFVLWSDRNIDFNREFSSDFHTIKISTMPDNIKESFQLLKNDAKNLKLKIKKERTFINSIKLSTNEYINYSTPLIIQVFYQKSNELFQEILFMPEEFVGLTLDELTSIIGAWQLKAYHSGQMMVLYKSVNDISPADRNKMYLAIRDKKIAVFYGDVGSNQLKEIIDIDVSDLPEKEKEYLKKGIAVSSKEELLSVLDGLISSINMD